MFIKRCTTHSWIGWSGRPTLTPDLWSTEVLGYYYTESCRTEPRMISNNTVLAMVPKDRLEQLVDESADIPQLSELHSALKELTWRRSQQKDMEAVMTTMRDLIEIRQWHPLTFRIRTALARLRQKWAL